MKFYLIILVLLSSCVQEDALHMYLNETATLITTNNTFVAGDSVTLEFKHTGLTLPKLALTNNYGTSLISASVNNKNIVFKLPNRVKQQSGCCYWNLLSDKKSLLTGEIIITPKEEENPHVENYLGPRNIVAGNTDFSMLVILPTDRYDNPLTKNTPVTIKTYYNKQLSNALVKTNNFIASKKIVAHKKEGKIAVTSLCYNTNSKELTTVVFPVLPVNFNITTQRNHFYADGNQLVTFTSSVIKDVYNNVVSDGTSVKFIVKDGQNNVLNAQGLTIGGIARVSFLHPSYPTEWKVKGYVFGAAQSNTLKLNFKASVKDFKANYSSDKRIFTVGPLKSYMQQLVPDGIVIELKITDSHHQIIQQYFTTSNNGYGKFDISNLFLSKGLYNAQIEAFGIEKNIQFSIYDTINK